MVMFGETKKFGPYPDPRPAILEKGWAPGHYANKCRVCGETFTGDKRASCCADCAYEDAN